MCLLYTTKKAYISSVNILNITYKAFLSKIINLNIAMRKFFLIHFMEKSTRQLA